VRIVPLGDEPAWVRVLGAVPLAAGWLVIRGYELHDDDRHPIGSLTVWTLHLRHILAVHPEHWPPYGYGPPEGGP
jgi:hypothetical protein